MNTVAFSPALNHQYHAHQANPGQPAPSHQAPPHGFPATQRPSNHPSATGETGQQVSPSIVAAWIWENRKSSNRWFWATTALLNALALLLGRSQYVKYQAEFEVQNLTWEVIWGQSTIWSTLFFIPILIGAFIAQNASAEHEGRNWQRMSANQLSKVMVWGKVAHLVQTALLVALLMFTETIITGLMMGFDLAKIGPLVARIVPVTLSILVVELVVAWLGIRLTSFAAIMTTALGATLVGLTLTLIQPAIAQFFPFSLTTAACASRDVANLGSVTAIALSCVISLAWALVWLFAWHRAANRAA